jgi:hypothetical protein
LDRSDTSPRAEIKLKASVAYYYKMVSASSQSKLPNLSRFIGKQGSGRTDVSVKAKELFGETVAAKHSVKIPRSGSDE